ncbi:MAG: phage portal protein [Bacteroidales bacterium]|nr:phage portal protein [Bacteroidales bacterium]
MSFLTKIFKRSITADTYGEIDRAVSSVLAGVKTKGVYVTEDTALTITTVWACVSLLSESVGILPIHLYKKTDTGREIVHGHESLNLVDSPNSYSTRMDLLQHLMVSVTLHGNGYARIVRDKGGKPVRLKLIDPQVPQPVLSPQDELFYDLNGEMVHCDDMIHVKGLVVDGCKGKSPIAVHRENLMLTMEVQKYGEQFFSNGGNTSGVFEVPGTLKDEAYNRLKAQLTEQYVGVNNSHKPMLLEGGMKYTRINIPLDDAQFLTTRKFQKSEIASIYRVPPHMVGDLERSTYSNIEQQSQEYLTYCLMPYLVKIETELNQKLLSYKDRETYYFRFGLNGLLRADSKSRSEYYKNMYMIGCMSPNEIRELEEMNKYKGGDEFYVQQNMTTTDNAINLNNEKK